MDFNIIIEKDEEGYVQIKNLCTVTFVPINGTITSYA